MTGRQRNRAVSPAVCARSVSASRRPASAMPIEGPVPGNVLSIVAVATVFTVMFDLGLAIVPGEFRWVAQRPALMLKGLFSVLIAVPVLALIVDPRVRSPASGGSRHRADGDLARSAGRVAAIARRGRASLVRAGAADRRGRARRRVDAAVDRGARRVLRRAGDGRAASNWRDRCSWRSCCRWVSAC